MRIIKCLEEIMLEIHHGESIMLYLIKLLNWKVKLTSKKAFSSAFFGAPCTDVAGVTDMTSARSIKPLLWESSIAS